MLRLGKVFGLTKPSIDGRTPIIYVESVADMGMCVVVTVIIVDNQAAVDYVRNMVTQRETPQCPMDSDF